MNRDLAPSEDRPLVRRNQTGHVRGQIVRLGLDKICGQLGGVLGLKFFARLKPYGLAWWDVCHFSRTGITSNAPLSRFDDEHAEAAQFDALAALQSIFHRLEQRLDGYLSFDFGYASLVGDLIYYV